MPVRCQNCGKPLKTWNAKHTLQDCFAYVAGKSPTMKRLLQVFEGNEASILEAYMAGWHVGRRVGAGQR